MKPESTDKVLVALYAEALNGGSFAEVTRASMGMEKGEFGWTLYVLQMMGLIEGCRFQPPRPDTQGSIMGVNRDGLMLTPKGFEAAGKLAPGEDGQSRLHAAWTLLRDAGCGVMANIVYRWIS